MDFLSIWGRIKNNSDLRTLTNLALFVGTTQQHVSKKKKDNIFPTDWAFKVGQKYGLNTDWIMTGNGSMNSGESEPDYKNELLYDIDRWLTELVIKEPSRKEWFMYNFLDAFPLFAKWKKSLEQEERQDTSIQNKAA